ncbi:ABC transporter ATP-binding protein [Clostridium sp. DSM 100503]|uniref:ABC transporter ATP-binding protein n=1 Tax=Clostridium sp. DSM 100503 TaxID=2963282 RepID=UPI00214A539C|nr:ABC transporter ATP-binding protein [Clostridium sp. DSM 100503]MCR1951538.1 ABC transporter ATP-binding protein [Clostridium sp. DSM 100503]
MKKILSVESLCKVYRISNTNVNALKDINLYLEDGEFLAIMGKSGSGKSTFLNIVAALDSPTSGKIKLEDEEVIGMYEEPNASIYRSENIGFIFQDFNLLKDLTVEENIVLPLILKGIKEKESIEKVNEIMKELNIYNWRKHRPVQLSGGQKQRVAIGRAIITNPKLLLADEPTGNLDYNTSIEILNILQIMKNKMNKSIIMVTHDPEVASYADRVLFFHDGEIIEEYKIKKDNNDIDFIMNIFKKIMRL